MAPISSKIPSGRGPVVAALAVGLLLSGCITEPDSVDNDATNVILQVLSMGAQPVTDQGPGTTVTDLFSDVCNAPAPLGGSTGCGVFNDNGVVTLRTILKDPSKSSSAINDVTIERYHVTYIRSDGRNVEGVDVPYAWDGVANFLVPLGTDVERAFVVVRHQAKSESPLREIQGNFAARLFVIAQIDFYGHDSAGRAIKVTGYLNITFSDFG